VGSMTKRTGRRLLRTRKANHKGDQQSSPPVLSCSHLTHSLSEVKHGFTHPLNGSTSVPSNPNKNETGQPCRLPVVVVRGVLMSAWASICCSGKVVSG
jgi:hypothetical protein